MPALAHPGPSLLAEAMIISIVMVLLCGLPLFWEGARRHSRLFFLAGTGALTGILSFDLLPDLFAMGGRSSLLLMGAVWAVYSVAHLSHLFAHAHEGDAPAAGSSTPHATGSVGVFLFSMIAHCLASGMLLVVSREVSPTLARTVFGALIAHKGYESLTVSSILIDRVRNRRRALGLISLYAFSLPAGVIATVIFRARLTQSAALVATSLAAGTLLGCLMFDFLIPSLRHVRRRLPDLGWIVAGLLVTQLVLKAF